MLGCLRKLALGLLFCCAVTSLLVCAGLFFWTKESREQKRIVIAAPEKSLARAIEEGGPAWVRIRVEVASGVIPLECGLQKCVWKSMRGFFLEVQKVKSGGEYTTRKVWKPIGVDPETVPIVFRSTDAEVSVSDWLGIQVGPELLKTRVDSVETTSERQIGSFSYTVNNFREVFLPDGEEAWAFGKFENGRPQVYLNNYFYLTSFGKARFAEILTSRGKNLDVIMYVFGFLSIVFFTVFLVFLLKKRTTKSTVSPISDLDK